MSLLNELWMSERLDIISKTVLTTAEAKNWSQNIFGTNKLRKLHNKCARRILHVKKSKNFHQHIHQPFVHIDRISIIKKHETKVFG